MSSYYTNYPCYSQSGCCYVGPPGTSGPPGPPGPQGIQGSIGPQGIQGIIGPIGAQGIQGPMGPQGIQGSVGPKGDTGARGDVGPQGIPGPLAPQSFVQLYDRNYTNEISADETPLNLSNIGINPLYTTGDYSLSTANVKNDTLNLPGSGIYHIDISLIPSFVYASPSPSFGLSYQILLNVVDEANSIITSLVYEGIIPNDADTSSAEVLLSKAFIYSTKSTNPGVKIILSHFNFAYAFENKLDVESLILVVQKWQRP